MVPETLQCFGSNVAGAAAAPGAGRVDGGARQRLAKVWRHPRRDTVGLRDAGNLTLEQWSLGVAVEGLLRASYSPGTANTGAAVQIGGWLPTAGGLWARSSSCGLGSQCWKFPLGLGCCWGIFGLYRGGDAGVTAAVSITRCAEAQPFCSGLGRAARRLWSNGLYIKEHALQHQMVLINLTWIQTALGKGLAFVGGWLSERGKLEACDFWQEPQEQVVPSGTSEQVPCPGHWEEQTGIYQSQLGSNLVFTEEKRNVIVTGDTLYLGLEAQSADLPWWYLGRSSARHEAGIQDVAKACPALGLLQLFHLGTNSTARANPEHVRSDCWALGAGVMAWGPGWCLLSPATDAEGLEKKSTHLSGQHLIVMCCWWCNQSIPVCDRRTFSGHARSTSDAQWHIQ